MAKAYRTDEVTKKKFEQEIGRHRNAVKPEHVPCPSAGCACSYDMYGHTPSDREKNVTTLRARIQGEHPGHTSEVLAVNQYRKPR